MRDEQVLALILARMVHLLRQENPSSEELRAALHALVGYTNKGSSAVRLENDTLTVEGATVPRDVPFILEFIDRMKTHGIAEVRIAHSAAALDLIEMLRVVAAELGDVTLEGRLARLEESSVQIVGLEAAKTTNARRAVRISEAIGGPLEPVEKRRDTISGFVPAEDGAAYNLMVELTRQPATVLSKAVAHLEKQRDPDALSRSLSEVTAGIEKAVRDKRVHEAIDAMIRLARFEEAEEDEVCRGRYEVALKRVLHEGVLGKLIPYLLDELYAEDVGAIMRRAGPQGTRLMLTYLVSAKTFAERRAYMEVLLQVESGKEILVSMLDHHEWFVVRNVADLVGEHRIIEGVLPLGTATRHREPRVKRSAGIALAKIGSPGAVRYLSTLIRDSDRSVRLDTIKHIRGRGLAALAMPLVNAAGAEEDPAVRAECFRALGRIGTPDAVRALVGLSEKGKIFKSRHSAGTRTAAVEGLTAAGGGTAKDALAALTRDRAKLVREAARKGLREIELSQDAAEQDLATDTRFVTQRIARPTRVTRTIPSIDLERRTGKDRRGIIRRADDRFPSGRPRSQQRTGGERRGRPDRRSGLERRLIYNPRRRRSSQSR